MLPRSRQGKYSMCPCCLPGRLSNPKDLEQSWTGYGSPPPYKKRPGKPSSFYSCCVVVRVLRISLVHQSGVMGSVLIHVEDLPWPKFSPIYLKPLLSFISVRNWGLR